MFRTKVIFRIVLVASVMAIFSCNREDDPIPYTGPYSPLAEEYAQHMDGTRIWKVKYTNEDTSYSLNDTSFNIHVMNNTAVHVWNSLFFYCPGGLKIDNTLFPADTARYLLYGGIVGSYGAALEYYYVEDSLIFYHITDDARIIYYSMQ